MFDIRNASAEQVADYEAYLKRHGLYAEHEAKPEARDLPPDWGRDEGDAMRQS